MWLPRWTTNDTVAATTFFTYKDAIINYFLEHKDLKLICRPHPLMLRNFLSTGEMTQDEVNTFLKIFADNENFTYDDNPDYIPSLREADIFVSDLTSLLFEEFITCKPVICLGTTKRMGNDGRKIASFFYHAKNWRQLTGHLEALIEGKDTGRAEREKYIAHDMKIDYRSGERIVEFLKRDFHGEVK